MTSDWERRVQKRAMEFFAPCKPKHLFRLDCADLREWSLTLLREFAEEVAVVVQKHIDEAGPDESCLYEIRDAIRSMLPKKEDTPDGD